MTKDKIVQVIKKYIVENIDDIDESDIDTNKSMADYGANSLDMIEVVSSSMRELSIKIPRASLTGIGNIDELANLFYEHAQESE